MADNNNHRVAELPLTRHPAMKRLAHLLGTWKIEGAAPGTSTYRMGLGGHYLIQEFETTTPRGRKLRGIEYVTCWTWFGDKGSDNFFKGKLSDDGRTLTGRWQWPGGGFDVVSRKTDG